MTPYRARIILPDEPGRLGRAATALSRLGINILDIDVQADSHEVVDSTVHTLELVHALAGHGAIDDQRATRAVRSIIRSDLAWITPLPLLCLTGAAAAAMISGEVTQEREWAKLLAGHGDTVWTMAVPFDEDGDRRVVTVLRRAPHFSFTEAARVQALMRVITSLPGRAARHLGASSRAMPGHC
jgi:ACT domain